jgi:hypothetical protein
MFLLATGAAATDCSWYRKVASLNCADGWCSQREKTNTRNTGTASTAAAPVNGKKPNRPHTRACPSLDRCHCCSHSFPATVGICPFSVIKAAAGLDDGKCADVNYTVPNGTTSQAAGPCGTLTFNQYTAPSVVKQEQVAKPATACCLGACPSGQVKYYSVDVPHGFCGETCISNWT